MFVVGIMYRHLMRSCHFMDNVTTNMASSTLFRSILKSHSDKITMFVTVKAPKSTQAYPTQLIGTRSSSVIRSIQPLQRMNTIDMAQYKPASQSLLVANMSYDSSNKVHQTIHNLITSSKKQVFVFMKGTPKEPSCRFSGVVVQILDAYGVDFDSCDVLSNEEIRQEIKSYSDWPTIPQVYMDGSFIGGCDILLQMHQSGELKQLFSNESESNSDDQDKTQK